MFFNLFVVILLSPEVFYCECALCSVSARESRPERTFEQENEENSSMILVDFETVARNIRQAYKFVYERGWMYVPVSFSSLKCSP